MTPSIQDPKNQDDAQQYLSHQNEPEDINMHYLAKDIRQELSENRFYLKHRVWRNNRKLRRHFT